MLSTLDVISPGPRLETAESAATQPMKNFAFTQKNFEQCY